jgi:hypothetical protein
MAFCTNVYVDSTMRFEAIASARFAALADISAAEAAIRAEQRCSKIAAIYAAKCLAGWQSGSKFALSEFSYQPLGFIFFQPKRVVINAAAALETPK